MCSAGIRIPAPAPPAPPGASGIPSTRSSNPVIDPPPSPSHEKRPTTRKMHGFTNTRNDLRRATSPPNIFLFSDFIAGGSDGTVRPTRRTKAPPPRATRRARWHAARPCGARAATHAPRDAARGPCAWCGHVATRAAMSQVRSGRLASASLPSAERKMLTAAQIACLVAIRRSIPLAPNQHWS